MILLDTNVVSELMKGQPDLRVREWLDRRTGDGLFVSAITQAEIGLGIALLHDGKRREALTLAAAMYTEEFAEANLPFDQGAAAHYATAVGDGMKKRLPPRRRRWRV